MDNIEIFEYNDMPISFITNDDGEPMVNATEMARVFGKEVKQWFDNRSTHEYIEAYATVKGIEPKGKKRTSLTASTLAAKYPSLIKVVKGGNAVINNQQGTFLCRNLTIELARWLNPMFAIWCDERILEYLQFGFTATDDVLNKIRTDPNFTKTLADELTAEREKTRILEAKIEENVGKVNFYDTATNLNDDYNKRKTILIRKIASKFNIPVKVLNKFLIRKLVIIRVDGGYDIHPQYVGADIAYQIVKEETVYDEYGDIVRPGIKFMEYTSKGVELITKLLVEGNIKKNKEEEPAVVK